MKWVRRVIKMLFIILGVFWGLWLSFYSPLLAQDVPWSDLTIVSLVWSPDGSMIATGYRGGFVRIWDADTLDILLAFASGTHGDYGLAWNPDGSQVASGNYDGTVRIWRIIDGQLLHTLRAPRPEVVSLIWSQDGRKIIATTPEVISLIVWDATTGALLQEGSIGATFDFKWSPDGMWLATGNAIGISILDGTTFERLRRYEIAERPGRGRDVYSIVWHPDGDLIASGSLNGTVRIWDADSGDIVSEFAGNDSGVVGRFTGTTLSVLFSDDGNQLSSVSGDGTVRTWEVVSGTKTFESDIGDLISAAAWNPDGTQLAYTMNTEDTEVGRIRIMPFDRLQE